jgi:hypothetical protein
MTWTSRERVIAAIEHREPDRVPINLNPVLDFYLNLKEFLGVVTILACRPALYTHPGRSVPSPYRTSGGDGKQRGNTSIR